MKTRDTLLVMVRGKAGARNRLRIAGWVLLASLQCGCGGDGNGDFTETRVGSEATVAYAPTPDSHDFYAQPEPMPDVPPGTVLKSEPITFTPLPNVTLPNQAWRIQFMSADFTGRSQAAVATVVKPLNPVAGVRKAALLSYQVATDSLGPNCAPSHVLAGDPDSIGGNTHTEAAAYLTAMESNGWTLVLPDHLGRYSRFLVGEEEGRITLDAIRAALNFEAAGLDGLDTPVVMWGYSGGAHATSWAASLQPEYAPELNIVGAASGGTPAQARLVVDAVNQPGQANSTYFGLIFLMLIGMSRAYPDVLPPEILNEKGREAVDSARNGCVGGGSEGPPVTGRFEDYMVVDDYLAHEGLIHGASLTDLPQPGRVPEIPMYFYHGLNDGLVPIEGADNLVERWCEAGANVSYFRDPLGIEHAVAGFSGAAGALLFLTGQVAGLPLSLPLVTESCNP